MSTKEEPPIVVADVAEEVVDEKQEPLMDAAPPVVATNEATAFVVPGGKWKNGLCGCLSACACPCLMGWCCFPILLGQLIERLQYNCFGCPQDKGSKPMPVCMIFTVLFAIFIIIEIVVNVKAFNITMEAYDENPNADYIDLNETFYKLAPVWYQVLTWIIVVWVWFIFIVSCCTRMNMRKQHNIDPLCCGDNCCDDCCTTWCCNCCSTIQMVRQTHDEDEYPYSMTSRTGLGPSAPEITV